MSDKIVNVTAVTSLLPCGVKILISNLATRLATMGLRVSGDVMRKHHTGPLLLVPDLTHW